MFKESKPSLSQPKYLDSKSISKRKREEEPSSSLKRRCIEPLGDRKDPATEKLSALSPVSNLYKMDIDFLCNTPSPKERASPILANQEEKAMGKRRVSYGGNQQSDPLKGFLFYERSGEKRPSHWIGGIPVARSVKEGDWYGWGKILYSDGASYEGSWKDGFPHGQGTKISRDGVFTGNFVQGKLWGFARAIYTSGVTYEGEWANDRPYGYGRQTAHNGDSLTGLFINGQFVLELTVGGKGDQRLLEIPL